MSFFRSKLLVFCAVVLTVILLFSASWCYVYANDKAGMSEIFTYTDFRNTKSYKNRLTEASEEMVNLVSNVYSGRQIAAVDLEDGAVADAFHYYFYADGVTLTDIPLLEGVDFSHAKALAVFRFGNCYLMDTNHTQTERYNADEISWETYDLTKTVSLTAFGCDAGVILVPDSDWIEEQYSVWDTAKTRALLFIIHLCLSLFPMIYLILFAVWGDPPKRPAGFPRLFTELGIAGMVLSVAWIIQIMDVSYLKWLGQLFDLFGFGGETSVYLAFSVLFTALALIFLSSLLSLVRSGRESMLIRGSFIWWFCRKPFLSLRRRADRQFFRKYRYSMVFFIRTLLFLILETGVLVGYVWTVVHNYWIALQIILLFVALVFAVSYLFGCYYDLRTLNRLLDHISELQEGNLSYRAEIDDNSVLSSYEGKLRSVGDGFDQTLRSQISAERSRINLITNVSHDLRTPLTSIIGYLDLLSKTELSAEARDYVTILTEKSNRLNHLVSDVFALSKANSGAEDIPMERLDLFLLARQLVADLSDSASASGKAVRLDGEGAAPICSNGNKIYRILQNMLDNALKYSLAGTRIFVTLTKTDGFATVTVKNTACYEMNFTADEISEQFVRGDPSRTGDGSGLGLAIAKSFAEQLGASFAITIDGDQFLSSITFPLNDET